MSYNAAGVLAHIASDGPDAWTIDEPAREDVLIRMVKAIERWNLTSERNINYRSFEPILGLVRCYDTPQCQHWAVWALANLTFVSKTNFFLSLTQYKSVKSMLRIEKSLPNLHTTSPHFFLFLRAYPIIYMFGSEFIFEKTAVILFVSLS